MIQNTFLALSMIEVGAESRSLQRNPPGKGLARVQNPRGGIRSADRRSFPESENFSVRARDGGTAARRGSPSSRSPQVATSTAGSRRIGDDAAIVSTVLPGSAGDGGLKPGDRIVSRTGSRRARSHAGESPRAPAVPHTSS